jgi:hypothetical protein
MVSVRAERRILAADALKPRRDRSWIHRRDPGYGGPEE